MWKKMISVEFSRVSRQLFSSSMSTISSIRRIFNLCGVESGIRNSDANCILKRWTKECIITNNASYCYKKGRSQKKNIFSGVFKFRRFALNWVVFLTILLILGLSNNNNNKTFIKLIKQCITTKFYLRI